MGRDRVALQIMGFNEGASQPSCSRVETAVKSGRGDANGFTIGSLDGEEGTHD